MVMWVDYCPLTIQSNLKSNLKADWRQKTSIGAVSEQVEAVAWEAETSERGNQTRPCTCLRLTWAANRC